MHSTRQITNNLTWVGVNNRRLAMFEGVYPVQNGMSYNSYLLLDEQTVLFDTVDTAVQDRFLENISHVLGARQLDYLVMQHIEPDHSASVKAIVQMYPNVTLVLNAKSANYVKQFYGNMNVNIMLIAEGDTLCTGAHTLRFFMAPMVHWPEVMVVYDETSGTLFSADAFGLFGALNGRIFADEANFLRDHLDEARRYYTNIVGKYGPQVQALLKKLSTITVKRICPLHGFVWRKNFNEILEPYKLWSSYRPEETGVVIAYASVYGGTENAAEILSNKLNELGIKTVMYDVSVAHSSDIIAACFKFSHLVFAAPTYNAGVFVTMKAVVADIVAHNLQNREIVLIENGTWAITSGKLMEEQFVLCKNFNIVQTVTVKSSVSEENVLQLEKIANDIKSNIRE